jgi:nucleotide-binding universal stress UspA family protein
VTVLLVVDREDGHAALFETGAELARAFDTELHVVHLVEAGVPDGDQRAFEEELAAELAAFDGLEWSVSLEHVPDVGRREATRVGNAVLETAADVDYEHVVMGHRTTGAVSRVTGGSVAGYVIDNAALPVTVVREPEDGGTPVEDVDADGSESEPDGEDGS